MPDSPTSTRPTFPQAGDKVKFYYEKGNFFRVIHVDGAVGGLTPTLDLFLSIYNQRAPIPQESVQRIAPNGQLGDEVMEERKQRDGVFREVEVGLVMNLNVAKALQQWLTDKIEVAEKTMQQLAQQQQHTEGKAQ
jgi:hypothetical protein